MPDRDETPEAPLMSTPTPTPAEVETEPATELGAPSDVRRRRARREQFPQEDVPFTAVSRINPGRADLAVELARISARIADDNRAKDVLLLDLRGATSLVDFFVIATAASRRQSHAIADEIDSVMKKRGEKKLGMEGSEEGRWVLIDYGDFVVHVFSPDARAYYSLEEIWGDAVPMEWKAPGAETPAPTPAPEPNP